MRRQIIFSSLATSILLFSALSWPSRGAAVQLPLGVLPKEREGDFNNLKKTPPPQDKAERADAFGLSIYMNDTVFSSSDGAKVMARIENKTGHSVNLRDLRSVGFNLSKRGKNAKNIRSAELFIAVSSLRDKLIDNYESCEFEVDLTKLKWSDGISSAFDFEGHRKMPEVVPAGDYYLFIDISLPAKNSTKEDPRMTSIRSNEIPVKWLGAYEH